MGQCSDAMANETVNEAVIIWRMKWWWNDGWNDGWPSEDMVMKCVDKMVMIWWWYGDEIVNGNVNEMVNKQWMNW